MSRWQSKGLWVSLASIICLLFSTFGLYDMLGITNADLQALISSILAFLTAAGVLSDPTTNNPWWADDPEDDSSTKAN
ncbi:MAG: phage holin [Bacillota bacterium]|nr:phage holin [Bacillota bacterium]